ncbi:MAG TPA: hypothetical protein VFQ46_12545, partial [Candidatus Limnocylindria bacterium]|nr:hypothetical protein [Candidatus Limnocylindria bacterium]
MGREQPGPGGGELDRQRQPVERPADLRHRLGVVVSGSPDAARGGRAVCEQPHGGVAQQLAGGQGSVRWRHG